ncbi:ABC transporter [Candidatus Gottesmanbacteria bacterium RIFCSPHIGHO2_01_FULL_42_12]|uniref:ABC transporter n=1 Tax=Candidatus Gottesmanbacteria bacterium RIFCSPHIGHO2_01_FULL_42_12 TaxID=1798377 RepID=A0A1F5Z0C5_9BACT|nr:MAG: ABC transporter [Candidatus Gottesmanbacteria bacterium RIFCSPHIGHO2_01_FULL_42_12]
MDPIITVKNLAKTFSLKQKPAGFTAGLKSVFNPQYKEIKAVDKINFTVESGEILAFIGPNGAGKSTTIKILTGILYPTSGKVNVLGFDPSNERQKLAFHIGSVFGQKPQLWYHLPPIDTYNLFSKIYELNSNDYQNRLNFLVDSFEITELLKTPVRKLSLGQRMRCEIVASLLHRPKVIFLDEPTIGLDVVAKRQIREVIKFLNEKEGVTIFLTSHDAGDIEALSERSIVINFGRIIFDDTTEKLKKNYIKSKIVELITENPTKDFKFVGGKIVEQTKYAIKVELDTGVSPIKKLLNYAVKNYDIKDINIFDPPMEEIIAAIYEAPNV